jgi:hypothetical protein
MGQNNRAPLGLASTTSRALPGKTGEGFSFPPTVGQESNAKPSFRDPADVNGPRPRRAGNAGDPGYSDQRRENGKDIGIFVEVGHE